MISTSQEKTNTKLLAALTADPKTAIENLRESRSFSEQDLLPHLRLRLRDSMLAAAKKINLADYMPRSLSGLIEITWEEPEDRVFEFTGFNKNLSFNQRLAEYSEIDLNRQFDAARSNMKPALEAKDSSQRADLIIANLGEQHYTAPSVLGHFYHKLSAAYNEKLFYLAVVSELIKELDLTDLPTSRLDKVFSDIVVGSRRDFHDLKAVRNLLAVFTNQETSSEVARLDRTNRLKLLDSILYSSDPISQAKKFLSANQATEPKPHSDKGPMSAVVANDPLKDLIPASCTKEQIRRLRKYGSVLGIPWLSAQLAANPFSTILANAEDLLNEKRALARKDLASPKLKEPTKEDPPTVAPKQKRLNVLVVESSSGRSDFEKEVDTNGSDKNRIINRIKAFVHTRLREKKYHDTEHGISAIAVGGNKRIYFTYLNPDTIILLVIGHKDGQEDHKVKAKQLADAVSSLKTRKPVWSDELD